MILNCVLEKNYSPFSAKLESVQHANTSALLGVMCSVQVQECIAVVDQGSRSLAQPSSCIYGVIDLIISTVSPLVVVTLNTCASLGFVSA